VYARVSTFDQEPENQLGRTPALPAGPRLDGAGVRGSRVSGSKDRRPAG
jgi:hypothetical protein